MPGEHADGASRVIPPAHDVPVEKRRISFELGDAMVHRDMALLRLAIADVNGDAEAVAHLRRAVEDAQPTISHLFGDLEA